MLYFCCPSPSLFSCSSLSFQYALLRSKKKKNALSSSHSVSFAPSHLSVSGSPNTTSVGRVPVTADTSHWFSLRHQGSEIYQEKLSKALDHHFRAKLLVFHSRLYLSCSFTTGPKQILEVVMAQLCQEVRLLVVQYIQGIVPSVGKGDMLHSSNAALRVPVSKKN
ncbi:hypothetical protein ACSBR1_001654 [Camellia fascicularis]